MKKLHVFVLKSYLGPLAMTFLIALFILLMQFLWKYVEDIVGKGLDFLTIAEFLMYATAGLVPMALPLAILLASLMTFGNMGENYELTALKAAGISLQRIMYPLVVVSIIISLGAFYFANYVLPYTNLQVGSMLYDIGRKRPELNIKTGVFNNTIDGFSIKVMRKNPETKMMYDFMIYDHSQSPGSKRVTLADSGRIHVTADKSLMLITLYSGENYLDLEEKKVKRKDRLYPFQRDVFEEQTVAIRMDVDWERTDQDLFKHHYQMMNIKQLMQSKDSLRRVLDGRKDDYAESLLRSNYLMNKRVRYVKNTYEKSDTVARDSVKQRLFPKKKYRKVLKRTVFDVKGKDSLALDSIRLDSMIAPLNLDSAFTALTDRKKVDVLNSAQQQVRRIMQNMDATKEQFRMTGGRMRKHYVEMHRKFTLSFACFIFFFIGAPLGAIIRKGGLGVPVVVSVVFFIAYYVVSLFGAKIAQEGIIPVWQGMWFASGILLPIGAFLTYKSTSESSMFNTESYLQAFEKFFARIVKLLRYIPMFRK